MKSLPKNVGLYIYAIVFISFFVILYMFANYSIPDYKLLALFIFLSIAVESLVVVIPGGAVVTVGYAVWLASMIILGPLGAAICASLGVMFRYGKSGNQPARHILNTPCYKTIFNGSQSFISVGIPSIIYYSFNLELADPCFYKNIIPLLITICSYLLLNASIMTKLLSMINNQSFKKMFIKNMCWLLPNCFVIASFGIFLSILYLNYGTSVMLLFFGPLLLARHSFKLYLEMKEVYFETVYALTKAVEAKDLYTDGHSKRVAYYAEKLALTIELKESKIETLKIAALLHDIGKIGIEDIILNKPERLTEEEFDKIKKHPQIGADILNSVDFLKEAREIILKHHEKYDGTGYPKGLKGEEIPVEAYILSLADAYDAMTSDRSYRKGMSPEKAISIINQGAGTHFHPIIAMEFIKIIEEELIAREREEQQSLQVQSAN